MQQKKTSVTVLAAAALSLAGALLTPTTAQAAPVAFVDPVGWNRGEANTTYQAWESFVDADGGTGSPTPVQSPNDPLTGAYNPNGIANTYDASGESFLTGGGNIYSFSAPLQVRSIVPDYNLGAGSYTTVLVQLKTLGTEPNLGGVTLTYNDGTSNQTLAPAVTQELYRLNLGGMGGADVENAFVFHVPHSAASLDVYIPASASSMSLDYIAVDTITTSSTAGFVTAVPEPAALAPLACGAFALLTRVRRRRRQSQG